GGIGPGQRGVGVEGELDSLCLAQELGDMAAVVTLGGASARPTAAILTRMLAAVPWFVATDGDGAGDGSAAAWPARARRVRPPEPFKDWTEAQAGGGGPAPGGRGDPGPDRAAWPVHLAV